MTRPELHNIPGFHAASLLAAAEHLRSLIPRKSDGNDTTALVRNEGRMNGFLHAIDVLIEAATPLPPKGEKREFQPYSSPQQPENQNKS